MGENKSMVQKEVKKKTRMYGLVAVLSALVLVTMVYSFGLPSIIYPPAQTPLVSGMKTFQSIDELKTYLTSNPYQTHVMYTGGPLDSRFFGTTGAPAPMPSAAQSLGIGTYSISEDYSTTNIQVQGVDEADMVKNDGQYIYTVSSAQNGGRYYVYDYNSPQPSDSIYIVSANPSDPKIVSKITLDNNTQPAGLFLSQNSNRLVVLASKYQTYSVYTTDSSTSMLAPYRSDVYTFIYVYDISDKTSPVLARNLTVSGSYFNSRMIGNYVYTVVSQPAAVQNDVVTLPEVYSGKAEVNVPPTSVYYADMNDSSYYTFTSFFGVDVLDDQQSPTNMTVVMGGTSVMYVSANSIYVTYPTWTGQGQYTSIYRVSINGLTLRFEAEGTVPGSTINQYAMDEYSGNFRIATNWQTQDTKINNVYVLNQNLTIVGKLEGLGQNENLHSVRFMGEKGYLVTFKKTDPLFVIDLSNPENPRVLGELKIPGYSDYLHPYDETHLIGVGKEAVEAEEGDFAWYQGLKLSLFDVANVNNPIQVANYVIGDRGTDSAVLNDPKAFLFSKERNLLVIPVNLALVADKTHASNYGSMVWQGAYVFGVSSDGNFTLKGTITHLDPTLLDSQGLLKRSSGYYNDNYYNTQDHWITRSLYIGSTLYTVSNSQIKLNSLADLSQIGAVNLQ